MKHLIYIFIVLTLFISFGQTINGQTGKLHDLPYERIVIDTDREVYVAGEKVHFKLSLFQGQSFVYSRLSKYAYVILVNESGQNLLSFQVNLSDGIFYSDFLLPDTLSTGGYRLISFTNWMRNFNPENYAFKNLIVANRFDNSFESYDNIEIADTDIYKPDPTQRNQLKLSSLNEVYHCGDSIIFSIRTENDNAEISISVAEDSPVRNINPDNYLEKQVFRDTSLREISFSPEIYRPVFQGYVMKDNLPVPGAKVTLTSPDTIQNFQYAKTNEQGVFRFLLSNYYDGRKLVFKFADQAESGFLIKDDNKFNVMNKGIMHPFNYQLKDYFIRSQKIVTIQKIYFISEQFINSDYNRESPPLLYAKPKSTVYPSDFIELKDMIEISREILPSVRISKKVEDYNIEMFNSGDQVFFKSQPLILFNGIPVDEPDQILFLGSKDISHIEIIDAPWAYGELDFQGVLGIFSADYNFIKVNPGKNSLVVDNPLPLHSLRFDELLPDSIGNKDHFPDFRQLLYWNPDARILSGKSLIVRIKAPQNEGLFKIAIGGIIGNGQPLSSSFTFLIKR